MHARESFWTQTSWAATSLIGGDPSAEMHISGPQLYLCSVRLFLAMLSDLIFLPIETSGEGEVMRTAVFRCRSPKLCAVSSNPTVLQSHQSSVPLVDSLGAFPRDPLHYNVVHVMPPVLTAFRAWPCSTRDCDCVPARQPVVYPGRLMGWLSTWDARLWPRNMMLRHAAGKVMVLNQNGL